MFHIALGEKRYMRKNFSNYNYHIYGNFSSDLLALSYIPWELDNGSLDCIAGGLMHELIACKWAQRRSYKKTNNEFFLKA